MIFISSASQWCIETNYGYGWEKESSYETKEEAERDLPEYQLLVKAYNGSCRIRKVVSK